VFSVSLLHIISAALIYRGLYKGGWLTHHYRLHDSDNINLFPVIFEPIAILCVIAYWIWRTRFFYRLMFILAVIQLLIAAGFVASMVYFHLTYRPRMM